MDYRNKITELRKAKGLNQKQLAALIYVSPPIICYIENAKRDTTIGMLQRIADALEVDIRVFFEDGIKVKHQFKIGSKCIIKYISPIVFTITDIDEKKQIAWVTNWGKESFPIPISQIEKA